jgi:hypothetical protein
MLPTVEPLKGRRRRGLRPEPNFATCCTYLENANLADDAWTLHA